MKLAQDHTQMFTSSFKRRKISDIESDIESDSDEELPVFSRVSLKKKNQKVQMDNPSL